MGSLKYFKECLENLIIKAILWFEIFVAFGNLGSLIEKK